jgi:tetratricopeptide (TPR) repeat protein
MRAHLAWHDFFAGDYDGAIEHAEDLRTIISGHFWSPFFSGLAHEQKGRFPTAIDRLREAVERAPDSTHAAAALAHTYGLSGDVREARRALDQMSEKARTRYMPAYDRAIVHLGLNETDDALAAIEQAFDDRSSWLIHLRIDPRLKPLHGRPRFEKLVARVGLPAASP